MGLTSKIEEEKKRDADRRELFQYDYGRKQFTDFNPRKHCDTYYNFDDKKGKRYGKAPRLPQRDVAQDQGSIIGTTVGLKLDPDWRARTCCVNGGVFQHRPPGGKEHLVNTTVEPSKKF